MSTFHPFGATTYNLSGSISSTATSITLSSFLEPVTLTPYTMVLLNTDIAFATIAPKTANSEFISFTGITQNANGTATLTGVTRGLAKKYPFTTDSSYKLPHSGQSQFIISDAPQLFEEYAVKSNDETITGQWTFNSFPITPSNSDASTTVKGVTKLSVAPASATSPIAAGTNDPRIPVAYAVDSVGTDSYAITPSPAITAYAAGQHFTFQAGTANTGTASLNVNGLGAKTIKKVVSNNLTTGDIILNQIVEVVYDGTNMQMLVPGIDIQVFDADGSYTMPVGAKSLTVTAIGAGGGGGGAGVTATSRAGGGGGGGATQATFSASTISSPVTVTLGTGGTAGSAAGGDGGSGGNTTFGSYLTAYGGGGGGGLNANNRRGGAGGGGNNSKGLTGSGTTGGDGGGLPAVSGSLTTVAGVSNYLGGASGGGDTTIGGAGVFGGGGGGGGGDSGQTLTGGGSVFGGGGGGGGGSTGVTTTAGGTSQTAGSGGAGGVNNIAGTDGSAGGGGGGGGHSTGTGRAGGAGGKGRVTVITYF